MQPVIIEPLPRAQELDLSRVPRHIAVIMDGNRRWAKNHGLPSSAGHWRGAEALTQIVRIAANLGVKILTAYAFSTEQWRRSTEEVSSLMALFTTYLSERKNEMVSDGIKLETIGDTSGLPKKLQDTLTEVKAATAHCQHIQLVLALNYGGRDDIRRAAISIVEDCFRGEIRKENLSEEVFSSYLDTGRWDDPDLLIRTSGEHRLSNFLLWQISYAEVYISQVLWPDFGESDLKQAILSFQQRDRRYGGS
jgi:undecaprenyl diphosphate synthase